MKLPLFSHLQAKVCVTKQEKYLKIPLTSKIKIIWKILLYKSCKMVCGWNTVLVGVRTATEELESIIEYIQPPHWYSKSQNQPIGYSINWANDLSTFRNSDCFLSVTVGFKLVHSFQCFPFNPTEFTTRCRKVGQSTSWQDRNVQICHTNFFGWKSHLHKFVVLLPVQCTTIPLLCSLLG